MGTAYGEADKLAMVSPMDIADFAIEFASVYNQ
jgi:hypothetical protein